MIVSENTNGRFIKDGTLFAIRASDGQTFKAAVEEAKAAGYTLNRLQRARIIKKAEIASARYDAEFGGFTDSVSGLFVRTDNRTRTLLTAAAVRAASDSSYEVSNWKTSGGTFITLSNATILALDLAVRDFIADQFGKEAQLTAQIDAAATVEEVESISW